jgi:hypothetical protein
MTQQSQPTTQPTAPKRNIQLMTVAGIVIILVLIGGFLLYQSSLQPNIQVTAVNIDTPTQTPASSTVVDEGRVSSSATFSYTVSLYGSYVLVWDNSFSTFSSKSVSGSYTVNGINQQTFSFTVTAGNSETLTLTLTPNDVLAGSFTVSGGSGNDVNFYITANTCSEVIAFSFTLVNSGTANGYSTVAFQSDTASPWSNRYYVQFNQQLPESGSVTLQDCLVHSFNIVKTAQQKA